jgi:hypothetical protein
MPSECVEEHATQSLTGHAFTCCKVLVHEPVNLYPSIASSSAKQYLNKS